MKVIIVTGGTGFIGAHLCEYLLEKYSDEYQIIAVDDLSGSEEDNIHELRDKGLHFVKLDLRDQNAVQNSFFSSDFEETYVIHTASAAHEGRSFFTPNENMSRNDQAYRIFLTEAIKHNLKKIVVFSSMSRYGNGWEGKYRPPFTEDIPTYPIDPYAVSKVAMEQLTRIQSKIFDFDYTILVPHNVFGEKQCYWDPYRNVLAIWMNLILNGKQPVIYGDGLQTRAFSYIDNCKKQMVDCLFDPATNNEIINIGGIKEYTINDAYAIVAKIAGTDIKAEHFPDRPSEAKHAFCSFQKSEALLDYKEDFSFEDGVVRMWDWVKEKGARPFEYMDRLELTNELTPTTWTKRLF